MTRAAGALAPIGRRVALADRSARFSNPSQPAKGAKGDGIARAGGRGFAAAPEF